MPLCEVQVWYLGLRKIVHHWTNRTLSWEESSMVFWWLSVAINQDSNRAEHETCHFFPMGKTCNKIKMSVNFAMKNEIQILSSKQKRIVHITIRHSVETGSFQFSSQIMFNAWALNLTSIVLLSCTWWCLLTIFLGNKLTHSHLKFV